MRIQLYGCIHVCLRFLEHVLFQIVHGLHAVFLPANFARLEVRFDGILESLRTGILLVKREIIPQYFNK